MFPHRTTPGLLGAARQLGSRRCEHGQRVVGFCRKVCRNCAHMKHQHLQNPAFGMWHQQCVNKLFWVALMRVATESLLLNFPTLMVAAAFKVCGVALQGPQFRASDSGAQVLIVKRREDPLAFPGPSTILALVGPSKKLACRSPFWGVLALAKATCSFFGPQQPLTSTTLPLKFQPLQPQKLLCAKLDSVRSCLETAIPLDPEALKQNLRRSLHKPEKKIG